MNAIERAASQTGCVSTPTTSNAQRVSFPASPATGFTATFSVTPSSSSMDAALGFFAPATSKQPSLSSLINFSPAGVILVRDGDSFVSSGVSYSAGETLQFRLVENLPATTYSLFVTPQGGAEIPLATNLQVPSDQRGATTLGGLGQLVNAPDGRDAQCLQFLSSIADYLAGCLDMNFLPGWIRGRFCFSDSGDDARSRRFQR